MNKTLQKHVKRLKFDIAKSKYIIKLLDDKDRLKEEIEKLSKDNLECKERIIQLQKALSEVISGDRGII